MVSVGTIVWLSSELMFFAGLFAMYFTARAQAQGNWPPEPTELNLALAVPVTLVLIASSFTCQMGVFAAELSIRGDVRRAWASTWHALKGVALSVGVELSGALLATIAWVVGLFLV